MTRKAINFDLDTHKLEEWYPTPNWRNAYMDIRNYMQEHGFEHRQGSGYISKSDMSYKEVFTISKEMTEEFYWLSICANKIDVTNIGKQFDILNSLRGFENEKSKIQEEARKIMIEDLEIDK